MAARYSGVPSTANLQCLTPREQSPHGKNKPERAPGKRPGALSQNRHVRPGQPPMFMKGSPSFQTSPSRTIRIGSSSSTSGTARKTMAESPSVSQRAT